MADAIAKLRELVESFGQCLLVRRAPLKERPDRFAQDYILNLAQVGVLKPAAQCLVVVQIECSILLRCSLEPFIDLPEHVRTIRSWAFLLSGLGLVGRCWMWFPRLDDEHAIAPLGPPTRKQDPKQSIPKAKARATSSAALQHGDLMAHAGFFVKRPASLYLRAQARFLSSLLSTESAAVPWRDRSKDLSNDPFRPQSRKSMHLCRDPRL